nr:MAG TPA: hypothetical protein [Caudoviricetes sp.]
MNIHVVVLLIPEFVNFHSFYLFSFKILYLHYTFLFFSISFLNFTNICALLFFS